MVKIPKYFKALWAKVLHLIHDPGEESMKIHQCFKTGFAKTKMEKNKKSSLILEVALCLAMLSFFLASNISTVL